MVSANSTRRGREALLVSFSISVKRPMQQSDKRTAVALQPDVGRLQAAVFGSRGVDGRKPVGGRKRYRHCGAPGEGLASSGIGRGSSAQERAHDEKIVVVVADFENGADGRMPDFACREHALQKSLASLRVEQNVRAYELQCDKTAVGGVLGLVDRPHTARPEGFDNRVLAQFLANHGGSEGRGGTPAFRS